MTKKDYIIIAKVLNDIKTFEDKENERVSMLYICQKMAFEFKKDNPRFDGLRFSKAIGYDYNITL